MGKQAKKKAPTSSAGGRGDKPRKKHPKVFDSVKRRLVTATSSGRSTAEQ